MTTDDLQNLRALCEAATPGPWKPNVWIETDGDEWRATGPGHDEHAHDYGSEPGGPDEKAAQRDAAFITASRTALPALIEEVERLRRVRAATQRELERWKHGQQIEGDYVCPDSLEADRLRTLLVEACDSWEAWISFQAWPRVSMNEQRERLSQIRALSSMEVGK